MAPFPVLADSAMMLGASFNELEQRGLGNSTSHPPDISIRKQSVLQILAVTFSSISVASAMLSFYWFVQMRRSFRHHLIMLLIQSDMFKALWFLIYPIVVFTHGPQDSTSTFCQVNGFFISLGIEASDFAILMIAIHTALYIFKPVATAGEGGLYPYRRIAYALWVILPILSASLAFINGSNKGYMSQGTYCYLPIRPFWFRLALSWIPRYAIFITIFCIYATIYFYVRYSVRNFKRESPDGSGLSRNDERNSIRRAKKRRHHSLPETPPLAYNGLLPESRANSFSEHRAAKPSISTLNTDPRSSIGTMFSNSYLESNVYGFQGHPAAEASDGFACAGSSCNPSPPFSEESTTAASSPHTVRSFDNQPIAGHGGGTTSPRPFSTASTLTPKKTNAFRDFFDRRFSPPDSSRDSENPRPLITMRTGLRHPDTTPSTLGDVELVDSQGQNASVSELQKTREKIRKQLRYLFIYPLVYIAMWIIPFCSHVLQYNDKLALNPPYALSGVTVVFITLQCAIDCWLFSTRERPWQHMPNNPGGTFLGSFNLFHIIGRRNSSTPAGNRGTSGPGKSRAEQVAEARLAYKRREEEAEAWKREDLERKRRKAEGGEEEEERMERNWWDYQGFDGMGMSPVVEEMDPLEQDERGPDEAPLDEGVANTLPSDQNEATLAPEDEIIGNGKRISRSDAPARDDG